MSANASRAQLVSGQYSTIEIIGEQQVSPILWPQGIQGALDVYGGQLIRQDLVVLGDIYANSIASGLPPGSLGLVGPPTGGEYGTDNIAGLEPTDLIADGFSKVSRILELLSPLAPPYLSTIVIQMVDTVFSAYLSGTSTLRVNVVDNPGYIPPTVSTALFSDGDTGVLTALVSGSPSGSITLTTADDTGINGYLEIVQDVDYYALVPQKAGFYKTLSARCIAPVPFAPGDTEYSYQLSHSVTGATNVRTFRVDNSHTTVPSVTLATVTGVTYSGGVYVSGVPLITTADTVNFSFQCNECVKKFYNGTWSGQVTSAYTSTATFLPTGVSRNEGSVLNFAGSVTPMAGTSVNNLTLTFNARNAAGTTGSATAVSTVRIDTLSISPTSGTFINETGRVSSGIGQFPVLTGAPFISSQLLSLSEELQLLSGKYVYPPSVDYGLTQPPGPDYTGLPLGTYAGVRWVTFPSNVINASFVTIVIGGQVNFGSSIIIPGFYMYVQVSGVTGWLSANDPYPGVSTPVLDGDFALDYAGSTVSSRRVTFGPVTRTGVLYIRIGLPVGSTLQFTGVSVV